MLGQNELLQGVRTSANRRLAKGVAVLFVQRGRELDEFLI